MWLWLMNPCEIGLPVRVQWVNLRNVLRHRGDNKEEKLHTAAVPAAEKVQGLRVKKTLLRAPLFYTS